MARANKFASVNLNDFYGKKEPAVKTAAVSGSGSAVRQRGAGHGGMLVLTRPVKQLVKVGGGNLGLNLKKEDHGSLAAAANNTGGWTKNSHVELGNNATTVDKSETSNLKNKRDIYVPPAVRASEAISVPLTSGNVPRFTAEKAEVLSGEEFPTLQASLAPESTNGQQQRMKDLQQKQKDKESDEKQQQEKLRQMSLQATSKNDTDSVVDRLQPMWSQLRPQQMRGDQGFVSKKSQEIIGRPDGLQSGNSHLTSGDHASDWADDERANGFIVKPSSAAAGFRQGSGYSDGISKYNYSHGSSRPLENVQTDYAVDVIEDPLDIESWHDKKAVPALGSGGRYQREPLPRPGSGGYRYESDSSPRPASRGYRYESGTSPRPSSGVRNERSEREVFFRPGSGGGMYEREVISRPGSGGRREREGTLRPGSGGRGEREVTSRPGSGGRHEREIVSQLGSKGDDYNAPPVSGGRYERDEMSRPGSGGGYYPRPGSGGRYERDVMHQPSSGVGYYPQPGSGGSNYEREVISRPLSGGSGDYSRAGSTGVDYRMMRPGSGGNDRITGGERYGNRDFSSNGKQFFDRQVGNPSRGYGSDVHYRGQNVRNTYESNRESGAFKDNWFRPGGMSGDDYGREQASHEDYGRDGAYDSTRNRQKMRQSAVDGRPLGQLREREEGFGGYSGVPIDDTLQRSWDEEKGLSLQEDEQGKANTNNKLFKLEEQMTKREAEQKWEAEGAQKMKEKGIEMHAEKECSFKQEASVRNLDQRPRLQIKEKHNSFDKDSPLEQHQKEPTSYSKPSDYYSELTSGQGITYPCRSSMSSYRLREPSIGAPGPRFSQPHVKTISRIPTASVNTGKYQLF